MYNVMGSKDDYKDFDEVLIIAGGEGSRVSDFTANNVLPKILLSLGNTTILTTLVNNYIKLTNRIVVSVNNNIHREIIVNYYNTYISPNLPKRHIIDFECIVTPIMGTGGTVLSLLDILSNRNSNKVLIAWSDIIISPYHIKSSRFDKSLFSIYVDNENNKHRMNAKDLVVKNSHGGNIVSLKPANENDGNVIGLYSINDVNKFIDVIKNTNHYLTTSNKNRQFDLFDLFINLSKGYNDYKIDVFDTYTTQNIDIGDSEKYTEISQHFDLSHRYFNRTKIEDDVFIKHSNNEKGFNVMEKEINFYRLLENEYPNLLSLFPKIKHYAIDFSTKSTSLVLENINYLPTINNIINSLSLDDEKHLKIVQDIYDNFCSEISIMHCSDSINFRDYFLQQTMREYVTETFKRISKVGFLFNDLNQTIKSCNGLEIGDDNFNNILERLSKYIKSLDYEKVCLIHGDPNTSNVFMNTTTNHIKFIDPKGYFGGDNKYGDPFYDKAKFVYGLTGYDNFNLDKTFKWSINDGDLQFEINKAVDINKLDLGNEKDSLYIKVLVGVIWIKLADYISNNPSKSICAYYHGLSQLNKLLPK